MRENQDNHRRGGLLSTACATSLLAIVVSGCTGTDSTQTVPSAENSAEETEIVAAPDPQPITPPTIVQEIPEVIVPEPEPEPEPEPPKRTAYDVQQARAAAIGRQLSSVVTVDGKEYKDVTVQRIDDIGVSMLHADGVARVAFDKLEPKWRDEFALSDEAAASQAEAEQEQRGAIADQRKLKQEQQKEALRDAAASRKNQARDRKIAKLRKLADTRRAQLAKNLQQIDRLSEIVDRDLARAAAQGAGDATEVPSTPASRKMSSLVLENSRLRATISHTEAEIQQLMIE